MKTITWAALCAAFALCFSLGAGVKAQPVATATVQPPARVDTGLRGAVLATLTSSGHAACQAECKRVQGCTGFNFAGGAAKPGTPNCVLFAGALDDTPMKGVVSCRMPCEAAAGTGGTVGTGAGGPIRPVPPAGPATPILQAPPLPSGPPTRTGPVTQRPPGTVLLTPPASAPSKTPHTLPGPITPLPPATPPAPPAPPTPTPRTGVFGYEVVAGPFVTVAPLAHAVAAAKCPAGKVAISAGFHFEASGNDSFGLEVRGAMPDGDLASVQLRNANVFAQTRGQAFAVCVRNFAGLRQVKGKLNIVAATGQPITSQTLSCQANERVVGGGVMGTLESLHGVNGAVGTSAGAAWQIAGIRTTTSSDDFADTRLLCAPEASVDGWEVIESAPVSLGAHSSSEPQLSCPANKAMLSVGVVQTSNNINDMVYRSLAPVNNTLSWRAVLHNRNILNDRGPVNAKLSAVCVKRE